MELTPNEYLNDVYKKWPGDWEGDFDYVEGRLTMSEWSCYFKDQFHSENLAKGYSLAFTRTGLGVLVEDSLHPPMRRIL
jgi:hypothetical protein